MSEIFNFFIDLRPFKDRIEILLLLTLKLVNMKTNKFILKLFILFGILFIYCCSNEIEENIIIKQLNLQENGLTTVPLENSFAFFNTINTTNKFNKSSIEKKILT